MRIIIIILAVIVGLAMIAGVAILWLLQDPNQYKADIQQLINDCLLYTSPSPRDLSTSRMPSSA